MTSPTLPALAPTPGNERIDMLDVLRGFALIGVCVANVEFFNRPVVQSGQGMQAGLAGLDWAVAWLVNYFVIGKFWTIFSLLFGMGFALMHERAQQAGRPFLPAYGRRIAALLVIGLLHHTLVWSGDILISYAIAAAVLMLTLFAPPRVLVTAFIARTALPYVPGLGFLAWFLAPIIFATIVGLYLRARWRLFLPLMMIGSGVMTLLAALVGAYDEGIVSMVVTGVALVGLGLLVWRFGEPASLRPLRAGLAIVLLAYGMIALESGNRYFAPEDDSTGISSAGNPRSIDPAATLLREREIVRSAEEVEVLTGPSYFAGVAMRASHLPQRLYDEIGFSIVLVGVFLAGGWFVRSGVIARAAEHLPLFMRMAGFGILAGVGLGIAGSLASTGRAAGADSPAYDFANGLMLVGSVPAALGYIATVVLMLHGRGILARIRVLAPFGRMALSNYLLQSVVFALLFYGYGAGLWGIGRAAQVGIALLLCCVQIGVSHWWMARFQYGPAEWVWRAVTYLRWPGMRSAAVPPTR